MGYGERHLKTESSRVPIIIAVVAMVIGAVLRIVEFARGRPLWLDEAMLGLNIASRSMGQLTRALDYDQTAPVLYLWIERWMVALGGVSERTLRALPFIAGLALVPMVWLAAKRLAGASAAAIATLLVAVSISLVAFSAEAKQYSVDAFASVVIVWLAARIVDEPNDLQRWMVFALGGVACLMLSQPTVFVLAGAVVALILDPKIRRAPGAIRRLLISSVVCAGVFVAVYFLLYRATSQSTYMRAFWDGTFLDLHTGDIGQRFYMFVLAAFSTPFLGGSLTLPAWVLPTAWLAGVTALWTRSRTAALIVALPMLFAVLASAHRFYPVMDRLFLFTVPLTMIALASLLTFVVERVPAPRRMVAFVAASALIAVAAAPTVVRRLTRPVFFAVGKQIIADVDSMSRGDPVYVAARSFPLWVFYTTDWAHPDTARLRWAASISGAGAAAHNNAPSRGRVQPREATNLTRQYRGRTEIVGLPTGRQFLTTTRSLDARIQAHQLALPLEPDTGWGALEAERVASVARPRAWVFGSHMFNLDGAEPALVAALQANSVRLLMERRQGSTVAYQVEFPSRP